ncbi:DUF6586 family protein [Halioxenophilus sp. WMMB6]|uniref:DUF6586 family protein n=1 Tax=Halioxenophilus sp. WMMB6 TaxID=3073815 RepID=UPI00295E6549|nr:DUF6586 family protein [Halioxenophilus sp. WMMB6]
MLERSRRTVSQKLQFSKTLLVLAESVAGVERLTLLASCCLQLQAVIQSHLIELQQAAKSMGYAEWQNLPVTIAQLTMLDANNVWLPELKVLIQLSRQKDHWLNQLLTLNKTLVTKPARLEVDGKFAEDSGSINLIQTDGVVIDSSETITLSLPQCKWLWSECDEFINHQRSTTQEY